MAVNHPGFSISLLGSEPQGADRSFQYLLIRILTGTAKIHKGGTSFKQDIDYSEISMPTQALSPKKAVNKFLADFGINKTLKHILTHTVLINRTFFKDITYEYINYFTQRHKGCDTAAFVFLYRILERVLYSVPLIYTTTQTDYYNTFKDLKDILKEEKDGEFGLYNKLIDQGRLIDRAKLDVTYQIDFSSSNDSASFFKVTNGKFKHFDSIDQANAEFTIKFKHVSGLLRTLRNRFFHTRTGDGQLNIKPDDILDPDEYFSYVNPVLCSYLSQIVLHIISHKLK